MPHVTRPSAIHHGRSRVDGVDSWIERMGSKIKPDADGCWIYNGKPREYGFVRVGGVEEYAHRMSFLVFNRKVDIRGMHVHHTCRKPGCVNLEHLQALTPEEHSLLHSSSS